MSIGPLFDAGFIHGARWALDIIDSCVLRDAGKLTPEQAAVAMKQIIKGAIEGNLGPAITSLERSADD